MTATALTRWLIAAFIVASFVAGFMAGHPGDGEDKWAVTGGSYHAPSIIERSVP